MLTYKLTITMIAIAGLFAMVPVMGAYAQTSDDDTIENDSMMEGDSMMMSSSITGPVQIGGLFPLSGGLSSFGPFIQAAAELAVEDFNAYLDENGAEWWLELDVEDTTTDPEEAVRKMQALHGKEITSFVGMATSASVKQAKSYADQFDLLIMSCCSTDPGLAIAGDSVYRLVPDDLNQGAATGKLLESSNISAVVPVWRGDTYGDGLRAATVANFEERGGFAHPGVRYNPDSRDFSTAANLLADYVKEAIDEYGADEVAVWMVAFDERVRLLQSAAQYDTLKEVRWFAAESVAGRSDILDDRIASEFIAEIDLTAMTILPSAGGQYEHVTERLTEELGEADAFTYPTYDSVWILGKAIMKADSTEPSEIKKVLPSVAAEHKDGAMSNTELNDAGDLILANYQIMKVVDNAWERTIKYATEQDILTADNQPTDEIEIGSLYPLTGGSSSTGFATREATDLGVRDFNAFLQTLGEEWRLKTVVEDSTSLPTIADEKVKTLFAQEIDIVIGPRPSNEVTQVKRYADTNNMMIISCCSTAPSLAIPGDSIYRIAVDDVHQGAGVSKLFEVEGIKAVVPIWRIDAYGQGLVDELKSRAESRGYVATEGVSYDPIVIRDYAVSVAALADQVQEQVDEYGSDRVAVFMTSFDESVPIFQAAIRYDVLSEVRWIGSETFVPKTDILDDPIASEIVKTVGFTAMRTADVNTVVHNHVKAHFLETYGRIPTSYIYSAYDAAWLVGLSMLHSGATDAGTIKTVFHDVAANYIGAGGDTILNEAGDLTPRNYAIWAIGDDGWMDTGQQYNPFDDTIRTYE